MSELLENIEKLNSTLAKELPRSLPELEELIDNTTGGYLGNIPEFIVEKIPENKSQEDFLHVFDDFIENIDKGYLDKAKEILNSFFENNIVFDFERKLYQGRYIKFGVVISNNVCENKLFVKFFNKNYKEIHFLYYECGPYVEPSVAFFVNSHLDNFNNFSKFYFANAKKFYMVSEYVHKVYDYSLDRTFQRCQREVVRRISEMPNHYEISDYIAEGFATLTHEKVDHYKILQEMSNERFSFLDITRENFIICEDKEGNKHCKMIDYGQILHISEN